MSIQAVSWVLDHSTADDPLDRLVLISLANYADRGGGVAWPSVKSIADEVRVSRRSVQRHLRTLEEGGHIECVGESAAGPRHYRIVIEGAAERRGRQSAAGGAVVPPELTTTAVSKTTTAGSKPTEDNRSTTTVGQKRADGLPRKIGRAATTKRERDTAVAVVGIWNELAGTDVTARAWAAKVIGRLRHLTETRSADAAHDLAAHRKLIEAALADPWWTGRPSPAVVYGNDRVFEQTIERAKDGGGRDELGIHRMRRWIDELEAA